MFLIMKLNSNDNKSLGFFRSLLKKNYKKVKKLSLHNYYHLVIFQQVEVSIRSAEIKINNQIADLSLKAR